MKKILLATLSVFLTVSLCDAQELSDSKLGKMVSSVKLQLVDGDKFKESKLAKVPEYYILYFSASW